MTVRTPPLLRRPLHSGTYRLPAESYVGRRSTALSEVPLSPSPGDGFGWSWGSAKTSLWTFPDTSTLGLVSRFSLPVKDSLWAPGVNPVLRQPSMVHFGLQVEKISGSWIRRPAWSRGLSTRITRSTRCPPTPPGDFSTPERKEARQNRSSPSTAARPGRRSAVRSPGASWPLMLQLPTAGCGHRPYRYGGRGNRAVGRPTHPDSRTTPSEKRCDTRYIPPDGWCRCRHQPEGHSLRGGFPTTNSVNLSCADPRPVLSSE